MEAGASPVQNVMASLVPYVTRTPPTVMAHVLLDKKKTSDHIGRTLPESFCFEKSRISVWHVKKPTLHFGSKKTLG